MAIQYGDYLQGFIKLETTYGTPETPVTGDAFRARALSMADADRQRLDPGDRRGTFDRLERVEGRHRASWSATVLWRPSESLGVPPDIGVLLNLLLGTETINGGTNVIYSQLADRSVNFATIWLKLNDIIEFVRGAVVQTCTITWRGDDFIVFEFAGVAKEYGKTGPTQADGSGAASSSLIVDDLDFLSVFSLIEIDGDDNGGAGYEVTAVDHTTETATIDPAATWDDLDPITAFLPDPTHVGDAIFGNQVSTSLDGGSTTFVAVGGQISIATGLDLLNEEEGSDSPTEVISTGKVEVSGQTEFVVRETDMDFINHTLIQQQKDLRITLGDEAAKRLQVDMDQVEYDPAQLDIPESGLVRVTLPFVALGSSGEDAVTMTQL